MKKISLYLLMLVAGIATTRNTDAKIWRVNNNQGKSCNFTNLTAALQSKQVQAGDTIHLEGSVTPYGKMPQAANNCDTIRKKLVIIGPGYLLNDNAETQHNKESAKVRTLFIAPEADGTVIAGIEQVRPSLANTTNAAIGAIDGNLLNGYSLASVRISTSSVNTTTATLWGNNANAYKIRIAADNVVVSHSKLYYVDLFNENGALNNITITKCVFNPGLIALAGTNTVNNLIISNNFFRNSYYAQMGITTNWYCYPYTYLVLSFFAPGSTGINNQNVYNNFTNFPVVSPTIQNNTFYGTCNLGVRAARLYNNIFFYNVSQMHHAYGLPVWPGTYDHDARNNIIFNGTANGSQWANPTASTHASLPYINNYGGMLNGVNGNQYSNVVENSWFVSSTSLPALDKSFVLGSGSPARDASSDDTKQRGMFGGLSPYVLSGLYTIPAVWSITIPSYPSGEVPSTGFEVQVKVKSH